MKLHKNARTCPRSRTLMAQRVLQEGETVAEVAVEALAKSAARRRELAALLDPDAVAPGVTESPRQPEIATTAMPVASDEHYMAGEDFAVTS